jgi:hypothetical protein
VFTGSPAIAISELRSLIDLCGLFRNFATLVAVSECLHLQELHSAALHFLQALSDVASIVEVLPYLLRKI